MMSCNRKLIVAVYGLLILIIFDVAFTSSLSCFNIRVTRKVFDYAVVLGTMPYSNKLWRTL